MKKILIIIFAMSIFSCSAKDKVDLTPIASFELNRYLGLWHEIARFEFKYERGMRNVTALYESQPNGMVKVTNSGEINGKRKQAIGKAKIGKPAQNGYLQVAFFWSFYAPYRVLMVDQNYSYALVSSGAQYLWILSRTPELDGVTIDKLLHEAKRRGFDTSKLIFM